MTLDNVKRQSDKMIGKLNEEEADHDRQFSIQHMQLAQLEPEIASMEDMQRKYQNELEVGLKEHEQSDIRLQRRMVEVE